MTGSIRQGGRAGIDTFPYLPPFLLFIAAATAANVKNSSSSSLRHFTHVPKAA